MPRLQIVLLTCFVLATYAKSDAKDPQKKFALLIGCSSYPNLEERFQLIGPANDVVLARKMLVERFQFPNENVVTLTESLGDDSLPTRANIEREWETLAKKVSAGDQVFVLMAGHGTQAPQLDESDDDPEPDGMDEMFLPRDVGRWDDTTGEVKNGIKDDDIRLWVAAIQQKKADLWVIIDACHSGTMTRDLGDEVKRELRPEALGIPESALKKAHAKSNGNDKKTPLFAKGDEATRAVGADSDEPVLVALYAAQSIEPTVEKKMPRRGDDRKYFGLLTYTMNEILSQTETKLTYRDLVQRIHRQYVKWGRVSPTPVLEGNGLDREVLGFESFPERPRILVSGSSFSGYKINAGALNGLTRESILALYPLVGAADSDKPIGHVKITTEGFKATESSIEPCEFGGLPAPEKIESGMRCKPVYVDLGDQRLRIAVDTRTDDNEVVADDLTNDLQIDLEDFVDENKHLASVAKSLEEADWLLRYDTLKSKNLFLTPVSGWHGQTKNKLPPLFGPAPRGDEFLEWLNSSLTKIARVQSLLRISADATGAGDDSSVLEVNILRYKDAIDRRGEKVKFASDGLKLYNGDRVGFQVQNKGDEPLDVTILLVDSAYGIYPLYPSPGGTNRLFPDDEVVKRGTINAKTIGLEHLIVIGVKGKSVKEPMSFACLAQPSIERSRAVGGGGLDSPLGKLFQQALYGEGKTRGFTSEEAQTFYTRTFSWNTVP